VRLGHRGILVSGGTSLGLGSTTPRAPAEGSGGTAGHTAKSYSGAVSATVAQRDDNLAAGYEALASGDWGAARDAFERALASGDSPEALDGLGRALWWLREERDAVVQRERAYAGFRRDGDLARAARIALWLSRERERRRIPDPAAGYPGLRMVLVHTIAHALMRRLALECGYSQASIRERLYALPAEDPYGPMAGILLYTAAPDSEGTLGGLVALGEPEELARRPDSPRCTTSHRLRLPRAAMNVTRAQATSACPPSCSPCGVSVRSGTPSPRWPCELAPGTRPSGAWCISTHR